jgi:hypothetical protein
MMFNCLTVPFSPFYSIEATVREARAWLGRVGPTIGLRLVATQGDLTRLCRALRLYGRAGRR